MLATANPERERVVGDPQRHSAEFGCIVEERYDGLQEWSVRGEGAQTVVALARSSLYMSDFLM